MGTSFDPIRKHIGLPRTNNHSRRKTGCDHLILAKINVTIICYYKCPEFYVYFSCSAAFLEPFSSRVSFTHSLTHSLVSDHISHSHIIQVWKIKVSLCLTRVDKDGTKKCEVHSKLPSQILQRVLMF